MNQQLRKGGSSTQFPDCVSDALCHITSFIQMYGYNQKGWDRIKGQNDLQKKIDTDLFCLNSDKRASRLNPLQELKLLGMMCTYFHKEVSKEKNPQRYHYFDIIFCGREGEAFLHEFRINFLMKLSVFAIHYPVYGLLDDITAWLNKISLPKSRDYAEQMINEISKHYILVPQRYKMYQYLNPISRHSFEFATYFLVFSTNETTLSPVLIEVFGQWMSEETSQFMQAISSNPRLNPAFVNEKFDLLLKYDSQNEHADDIHHRFHFVITFFILNWHKHFSSNFPSLGSLTSILQNSFSELSPISRNRLFSNLNNLASGNLVSVQNERELIEEALMFLRNKA